MRWRAADGCGMLHGRHARAGTAGALRRPTPARRSGRAGGLREEARRRALFAVAGCEACVVLTSPRVVGSRVSIRIHLDAAVVERAHDTFGAPMLPRVWRVASGPAEVAERRAVAAHLESRRPWAVAAVVGEMTALGRSVGCVTPTNLREAKLSARCASQRGALGREENRSRST